MANKDRPNGLRPKGEPLRANKYTAGGAIYPGDCVKLDSAGKVVVASASNSLCGVAASYASADGAAVMVWDHPDQLFVAQADDATVDALADLNLNYNITATAGNSTYKMSRHEVDGNTGATDSTLPLRVLAATDEVGESLGSFAKVVCKINAHQLAGNTEGV